MSQMSAGDLDGTHRGRRITVLSSSGESYPGVVEEVVVTSGQQRHTIVRAKGGLVSLGAGTTIKLKKDRSKS